MRRRLVLSRNITVRVPQRYDPRNGSPDLLIGQGAAPRRHQVTGAFATEGDGRVQHLRREGGALAPRWRLAAPPFPAVTVAAAGAGDYFHAFGYHRRVAQIDSGRLVRRRQLVVGRSEG